MKRRIQALLGPLRPHMAAGYDKLRLGSDYDGGYVLLDDFAGLEAAIGCGVGWDVTFEHDLALRGIPVHLFDHTVSGPPQGHKLFTFHRRQVGVGAQGAIDLTGIAELARLQPGAALLKVDIEGDEWSLFAQADRAALRPYRQIVCEMHWLEKLAEPTLYATALAAVRALTRDFAVVHVHANNHSPMLSFDGLLAPSVLELTFASRRHYRLRPSGEEFPTLLDAPNNRKQPDYWLGRFDHRRRLTDRLLRR